MGVRKHGDGERDLIAAVIQQAITDLNDNTVRGGATWREKRKMEVIDWFLSPSSATGSFRWYAGMIGLDSNVVLERLRIA